MPSKTRKYTNKNKNDFMNQLYLPRRLTLESLKATVSHCELNRRVNVHYRHTAFKKNSMTQAASYLVVPSLQRRYGVHYNRKGTAKDNKKWMYICPQRKLVIRIQYVRVYLSAKSLSVSRQSQAPTVT